MNPKPRKWWIAGILSLLLPGLGQVYNFDVRKGLIFLAAPLTFAVVISLLRIPTPGMLFWSSRIFQWFTVVEAAVRARHVDLTRANVSAQRKGYIASAGFGGFLVLLSIFNSLFLLFRVPSGSMEDNLWIGDHILVRKFSYGATVPKTDEEMSQLQGLRRNDVVVFEAPAQAIVSSEERKQGVKKDFIKRVVGLPGDTIKIKNKHLYVNGVPEESPYPVYKDRFVYPAVLLGLSASEYQKLWESGRFVELQRAQIGDNFGPVRVPPNCYFVIGDNRDGSFDSRFWGPLPARLVKGKAARIFFPFKRFRRI